MIRIRILAKTALVVMAVITYRVIMCSMFA